MKKAYVTALVESIAVGHSPELTLTRVKTLMDKKGHSRMWLQVLKAAIRELEVLEKRKGPHLTLASGDINTSDSDEIKKALEVFGVAATENYHTTIDQTLVGGFIVRVNGLLLDRSYKRALLKLYEQITK